MKKMSAKLVLLTLLATAGLCVFSYDSRAADVFNSPPGQGQGEQLDAIAERATAGVSTTSGADELDKIAGGAPKGANELDTIAGKAAEAGAPAAEPFIRDAKDAAEAEKSKLPPVTDNTLTALDFMANGATKEQALDAVTRLYQEQGFPPDEARKLAEESLNAPASAGSIAQKSSGTVNSAQCDVIRAKVLAAAELKIQQTADTIRKQTAVGPTSLLSCSEISAQGIANTMSKVGKGSAGSLLSAFVDGSKIASSGTKVNVNVNGILNGVMASGGKVSVKSVLGGILGGASGVSCKNTLSNAMKAVECTSNFLSKKGAAAGAAAADCVVNVKKMGAMFGAGKSSQVKEIEKGLKKDSKKPIEGLEKAPPPIVIPKI